MAVTTTESQQLEEVIRLLAIQVAHLFESQPDAVRALSDHGFTPARITELLGANAAAVRKTVQRAKKR